VDAAFPAQPTNELAIDDPELEPELVAHFLLPLALEIGRRDDDDPTRPVTKDQLLGNEASLDRLAQPNVVGDEKGDTRHADRSHERVELVPVDLDAGLEWRKIVARVGVRRSSPSHSVEEGIEPSWLVEGLRVRKGGSLEGARAGLDLPDDLNRLVRFRVVVDATKGQEVLAPGGRLERVGWKLVRVDLGDHPPALAYVDELTLLRDFDSRHARLNLIDGQRLFQRYPARIWSRVE
jgi:hypothetical protein